MEDFMTASWNGHTSLHRVFWIYHVVGGFLTVIAFLLLKAILGFIGVMLGILVLFAYTIWILVSLWQCSYNCVEPRWTWITRAYVYVMPVTVIFILSWTFESYMLTPP